jgi:hypothetical protein
MKKRTAQLIEYLTTLSETDSLTIIVEVDGDVEAVADEVRQFGEVSGVSKLASSLKAHLPVRSLELLEQRPGVTRIDLPRAVQYD